MLKSLILFTLFLNVGFAKEQNAETRSGKTRFSESNKKRFLDDVKQGVAEHKVENKGRVDLQIIKPGLYAELEESYKQEQLTMDEMNKIKQDYEKFSADRSITPNNAEQAFYVFINAELEAVNKRPIENIREGNVCNNWRCEDGLKCAPDPLQLSNQGKRPGVECSENSECASQDCSFEKVGSKKKVCEDIMRCYRPLQEGKSCMVNPVCGIGLCSPYNLDTAGIGWCTTVGASCKSNTDCCSNLCDGSICKKNNVCKDCVEKNIKLQRGQKCCEGLYPNLDNICSPVVPPSVMESDREQTYISPAKSFIISFVNFFISSADAGEIANVQAQFDAMLEAHADVPIGAMYTWGNGTLKKLPTGNMLYTPVTGASVELTEKSNIVKVANASPEARRNIAETYGLDPLGFDKDLQSANAKRLDDFNQIERTNTSAGVTSTAADIPGFGKVTYNFARTEGSGDNMNTIPASIVSAYGKTYNPASDFYASNEYAAMVGKKMTAEDYKFLEDEKAAATKTAQSGKTDGSDASALEDEETFLNLGVANDGLDLKSGIMADQNKYKNFQATSKEGATLDVNKVKPTLTFNRKSNFTTCDIYFKDDFYNSMKANGTFDLEIAMLGFDFVSTGDSDSDYWKDGSIPSFPNSGLDVAGIAEINDKFKAEASKIPTNDPSIFNRMKAIGLAHREIRATTNVQIAKMNKELTCACLDVQGYNKITNDEKKNFFKTSCSEYAKYTDPNTSTEQLTGDASGLKGKQLLVDFTSKLALFHRTLSTDNAATFAELDKVSKFVANTQKWNSAEARNYDLFKFNIKNPSGSVAALGAIVGALLAAGVIALLGGFATTSILSAWAAAGIITASAATGAGGLWMIATLKGAWITMRPVISDYEIAPRTYSCGKKESCTEYTRTLVQPYNQICNAHTSANACIKSFVIFNDAKSAGYLVDPWIPYGVSKAAILRNQPNYVEKLEAGFQAAKNAMVQKNPGATGGGGKKGGGDFVSESYLAEVFIDGNVLGQYTPAIGQNMKETYFLGQDKIKLIKDAAKAFAVSEGFLLADDTENLKKFADYAYEYHFVWPKKTRPDEISYPTVGLTTYLDYMAVKVSGNLATGLSSAAGKLSKLEQQYRTDLKNIQELYDRSLNQVDGIKKQALAVEVEKNNQALANLMNFNSLLDSNDLDARLKGLNPGSNGSSNLSGSTVGAGGLSGEQGNFLRAVSNLRKARQEQLKSLNNYTKVMAANGDKERNAKIAAASKKFSDNFSRGNSSFGGMSSSGASAVGAGLAKDAADGAENNHNYGNTNGNLNDNSNGSGNSGSGALYGSGSGSSSSKSGSDNGGGYGGSRGSDADNNKLSEAIDARNKNSSKYQSAEGQTLFEKVTNAYIRNYDKVLSKKKDKDVIEEKQ